MLYVQGLKLPTSISIAVTQRLPPRVSFFGFNRYIPVLSLFLGKGLAVHFLVLEYSDQQVGIFWMTLNS
jgi:hypothetical protein